MSDLSTRAPPLHFAKSFRASWCTFPEWNSSNALVRLSSTIFCWALVFSLSWLARIRWIKAFWTDFVWLWMSTQRASTVLISVDGVFIVDIITYHLWVQRYENYWKLGRYCTENLLCHTENTESTENYWENRKGSTPWGVTRSVVRKVLVFSLGKLQQFTFFVHSNSLLP